MSQNEPTTPPAATGDPLIRFTQDSLRRIESTRTNLGMMLREFAIANAIKEGRTTVTEDDVLAVLDNALDGVRNFMSGK